MNCCGRSGLRSERRPIVSADGSKRSSKNVDVDDTEFRNPAELTKQLREKLPRRPKRVVQHHPALPYAEAPQFIADLSGAGGTAALMLRFLIFTACRTNEVVEARWSEIDHPSSTWKRSPAISSPSCALVRFHTIDARKLLCRLLPRPIVASWHVMRARISGSDLVGHATVGHASIRGRNRFSSRSRSQSARQVAILSGWVRPVAGKEAGRVGLTRVAEARRSLPRLLGRARTVGGREIPQAASGRGVWWSRQGWSGSIRSGVAHGGRRCAGR